ncbi:putative nuclease HARBI1 [Merluccius polli]|uniref:Nuclease HARBI1 n=1 Tax=Merluccius polli TaxID=89951 RepID=A0AA47P244_MERPO|nr:putative nuclease HARBI1 [Merluccius polli]
MTCPFDNDPVDEGAALLRRELNIRREMVIRPRIDRYRFTSQSIIYIHNLIRPYICNITNRSHALTSQQILCVALCFFANGSFLYNVRDAECLSKATVCRAVRKVCLAMKRLLPMFVGFPGHKPDTDQTEGPDMLHYCTQYFNGHSYNVIVDMMSSFHGINIKVYSVKQGCTTERIIPLQML